MGDPLNFPLANNATGNRPVRPTLSGVVNNTAQPPQPQAQGDSLAVKPTPTVGQVVPEEATTQPFRDVSPNVAAKIANAVGSVFAKRPDTPPTLQEAPPPVFDPTTATTYGDGSLQPPAGRPGKNLPFPGQGKVTPPGLTSGNSVMRYGQDGSPNNFQILDQGDTNGCGTTSLAMMLDFMAGGKKVLQRQDVDAVIRHYDMFTSPGEAAAYARRRGMEATIHDDTSMAQLKLMIDRGLPLQVLLDVSDAHDGSGLHYEVVTGYGTGPDGKSYVELANPWGQREYMPEATFMKAWSNLTAKGFPLGINRVAITLKPKGTPAKLLYNHENAGFDTGMTALRVARGLTQVTSGWARHDVSNLLSGGFRLVAGGLFAIPALLGFAGRKWANRVIEDGAHDLSNGPTGFLVGLGKIVGGAVVWGVSLAAQGIGNLGNRIMDLGATAIFDVGRAIGKLFRKN